MEQEKKRLKSLLSLSLSLSLSLFLSLPPSPPLTSVLGADTLLHPPGSSMRTFLTTNPAED